MSHILLNYAFLLFWSILGEIYWEQFFLDIKVTISETRTEILRKFVFLTMFNRANSEENFVLFLQIFLIKTLKGIYINKNRFSSKCEPNTAKLCLSVVLKHFGGKL